MNSTPEKIVRESGWGRRTIRALPPTTHATCGNSSTRSSRMKRRSGDRNAFAVAKCTGTSRRPRSSSTSASSLHARLQQSSSRARELTKTSTRTSKLQCSASMSRTQQAAHDEFFHERGVNVQAARASGHLPVSQSPLLAAFASQAPRNSSTSAAESPVLAESPARPVVQSRKLSEAAKEKLDAVWADAIYATALPFNLLDHPSIRTAINTTADLVRTLGPLGVLRRSSEFRCCRGGV